MTNDRSNDRGALEHAFAVGNHAEARRLAREIAQSSGDPLAQERARFILRATERDWFLSAVGVLGLGLTAWLVYKYVL
jgi:hypothetical protein